MVNSMLVLTFGFKTKIGFLAKFGRKVQNFLPWNLGSRKIQVCWIRRSLFCFRLKVSFCDWYPDYFEHAEFNGDVHVSCFGLKIPFWSKFSPKNQLLFKIMLVPMVPRLIEYAEFNVIFICPAFDGICWIWWWCSIALFWTRNILFFMKFGPKSQNCLFKMKRGIYNNSNNTIVMFSWPVLGQTYTFGANSVRKIEIVYFLPWCMTFAKWRGS